MDYNFGEIHALNLLSDNPDYSKYFNTPKDLKNSHLVNLTGLGHCGGGGHNSESRQNSACQRLLADMVVRAPISGSIDGVAIKGLGELLNANATLLTLRPQFKREDLVIEIQIPSSFAVWVEQGMEFRASAQGNNPDDHGYISGTVEFVSKSTTEDKAGARFFRIIGHITDFDLSARGLEPAFLRPGLELSVEIKAGQRRLINYIFDPFTKHFLNALKEPS